MNSEISDFIVKIKKKFIELNDKYRLEINNTKILTEEIEKLNTLVLKQKDENLSLKDENLELQNKNLSLTEELEILNDKKSEFISNQKDEEEINELVREIDYCIKKLKE